MITTEQYENHDCTLTAEDSCNTCEQYAIQQTSPSEKIKEATLTHIDLDSDTLEFESEVFANLRRENA